MSLSSSSSLADDVIIPGSESKLSRGADLEHGEFNESSAAVHGDTEAVTRSPECVVRGCGTSVPLYRYEKLPRSLRWNPHIKAGYRISLSYADSLRSVFLWTNETVNIWSHLLGFLYFAGALVHALAISLPSMPGATRFDYTLVSYFLVSVMCTMLFSTAYHVFSSHCTQAVVLFWLRLDLCGIILAVWACFASGTYYAFYCFSYWQQTYFILIIAVTMLTILLPLRPWFLENSMQTVRVITFVSMVMLSLVPVSHWLTLNGGFQHPDVILFFPRMLVMWLLFGIGIFFYVSRIPETCSLGGCDYVGASHQLWHIAVFVALAYWHYNSLAMIEYRHQLPCHIAVAGLAKPVAQ